MKMERDRAHLPEGYVESESLSELLEWSYVEERMRSAKHYWLATVSPAGVPHTRPVAGMWLDGRLYMGGSPDSNWYRNAVSSSSVCLTLSESDESDRAVIIHGRAQVIRLDRDLSLRLVSLANDQYGYDQTLEQYEGQPMMELTPEVVLAWTELANATRWRVSQPPASR